MVLAAHTCLKALVAPRLSIAVRSGPRTTDYESGLPANDPTVLPTEHLLAVKGERLYGAGGCVVSGGGCSVDGVEGVADRCDGQPVPGCGEVRQGGPGGAGQVVCPDRVEHGAGAFAADGDQPAADDRRAADR